MCVHRRLNSPTYSFHSTSTPSYDPTATDHTSLPTSVGKAQTSECDPGGIPAPTSPARRPTTCSFPVLACPGPVPWVPACDPLYHRVFFLRLPTLFLIPSEQLVHGVHSDSGEELAVGFVMYPLEWARSTKVRIPRIHTLVSKHTALAMGNQVPTTTTGAT